MDPADLLQLLSEQQDRRLRVIENLLRGRRTVSTLYWGLRYDLLPLLNLAKPLDRGALDVPAQLLAQQGLIAGDSAEGVVHLTERGRTAATSTTYYRPITRQNWVNVDLVAARQRLLLAVQVASQYAHSTSRYYPLATDLTTRQAVRRWFHRVKGPNLATNLREALVSSLRQLPAETAAVVTDQFTGYKQPGYTVSQLAQSTNRSAWEIQLMHFDGVAQIALAAQEAQHPLHDLFQPLWSVPVSRSAQQTLQAVEAGGDLARVARVRKVKLSTVREHLLEAAIMLPATEFPYDQVLSETIRQRFAAAVTGPIDSWQYMELPAAMRDELDFFYFRLYAIWRMKRGDSK